MLSFTQKFLFSLLTFFILFSSEEILGTQDDCDATIADKTSKEPIQISLGGENFLETAEDVLTKIYNDHDLDSKDIATLKKVLQYTLPYYERAIFFNLMFDGISNLNYEKLQEFYESTFATQYYSYLSTNSQSTNGAQNYLRDNPFESISIDTFTKVFLSYVVQLGLINYNKGVYANTFATLAPDNEEIFDKQSQIRIFSGTIKNKLSNSISSPANTPLSFLYYPRNIIANTAVSTNAAVTTPHTKTLPKRVQYLAHNLARIEAMYLKNNGSGLFTLNSNLTSQDLYSLSRALSGAMAPYFPESLPDRLKIIHHAYQNRDSDIIPHLSLHEDPSDFLFELLHKLFSDGLIYPAPAKLGANQSLTKTNLDLFKLYSENSQSISTMSSDDYYHSLTSDLSFLRFGLISNEDYRYVFFNTDQDNRVNKKTFGEFISVHWNAIKNFALSNYIPNINTLNQSNTPTLETTSNDFNTALEILTTIKNSDGAITDEQIKTLSNILAKYLRVSAIENIALVIYYYNGSLDINKPVKETFLDLANSIFYDLGEHYTNTRQNMAERLIKHLISRDLLTKKSLKQNTIQDTDPETFTFLSLINDLNLKANDITKLEIPWHAKTLLTEILDGNSSGLSGNQKRHMAGMIAPYLPLSSAEQYHLFESVYGADIADKIDYNQHPFIVATELMLVLGSRKILEKINTPIGDENSPYKIFNLFL